jgi:hypothetical protein
MLDSVAIMGLIETFRLDEHLFTLQQASNACLTGLGSFFALEFRRIARKIIGRLFVGGYVAFVVTQNNFVI